MAETNTLVVYFSLTGKTKLIAETIAGELDADIEEIVPLTKYDTKGFALARMSYAAFTHKRHPIQLPSHDPSKYNTVVIGTPVWANNPTPPINTYLHDTPPEGRRVYLFATTAGDSSAQNTFNQMRKEIEKHGSLIAGERAIEVIESSDEEIIGEAKSLANNIQTSQTQTATTPT